MDQVPEIDFTPEKSAFRDIAEWAERIGLSLVPEDRLESDVKSATDRVYQQGRRRLYVRAQPKSRSGQRRIDLDARPALRHVRLLRRSDANAVEEVPWN